MPPLRRQRSNRRAAESDESSGVTNGSMQLPSVDVKYNPELLSQVLKDLSLGVETKCAQIENDTEFMITSMQQMFHLELIKLPTQVKHMSMKQFREEFGCSLEAVTRGAIAGKKPGVAAAGSSSSSSSSNAGGAFDRNTARKSIYQTPMQHMLAKKPQQHFNLPTAMRAPREGEVILSSNGSPLGSFTTVQKPSKPESAMLLPPQTPAGVYLPSRHGEVVGIEDLDVESLSSDAKIEAYQQMQAMMENMKVLMDKLQAQM